jgi:hypothetical protein
MQKVKDFLINAGLLIVALPVLAFTFIYGMGLLLFSKGGMLSLGEEPFDIYPKGHPLSRK